MNAEPSNSLATRRYSDVLMVPVDSIQVLNPRERNQRVFESVVENIRTVGLKKPIVVTPRVGEDGETNYLLVCGEGRLNAFRALGLNEIPALLAEADDTEAYVMSLVENVARRQHRPLEILSSIRTLGDKGYSPGEISQKTGLTTVYISGILNLLKNGEERLLTAVEKGVVPLNTALAIVNAGNDDVALQTAMQEAYETGELRGSRLKMARQVVERRKALGVRYAKRGRRAGASGVSGSSLVKVYAREVDRKKLILKKSDLTQQRLLFVVSALRRLLADEHFATLLRAEGLDVMPAFLAERVWPDKAIR